MCGGILFPHGEQTQERQPGWASHALQLTRAAAQYPASAPASAALPWVVRPPHWDRLCSLGCRSSKNAICSRCFPKWERRPESTFQCLGLWPMPPIPLCELRALGPGKGAPTEAFLSLTSENLGNLRISLLDAKASEEARHDQLIGIIPKLTVLCKPRQGVARQYHWSLRLETWLGSC